ncbi:MAG: DUF6941 family protein [Isosphaeraceae bacterium]
MNLRFAFLANGAEVGRDGRFFVLGGGIDGLLVQSVPTIFPAIAVMARIHFSAEECENEYEIKLSLTSPDESDLGITPTIRSRPKISTREFAELGSNVDASFSLFGIPFTQVGIYRFHILVNDIEIGDYPFLVRTSSEAERREERHG